MCARSNQSQPAFNLIKQLTINHRTLRDRSKGCELCCIRGKNINFNWLFFCGRCWFLCLYPQRCGACPRTLRETAALQPPQVQLFPLRAGLIRQTGSTGGNRENHLRGLCGEGKSESAPFTKNTVNIFRGAFKNLSKLVKCGQARSEQMFLQELYKKLTERVNYKSQIF